MKDKPTAKQAFLDTWEGFDEMVMPRDTHPDYRAAIKLAFMSGAFAWMEIASGAGVVSVPPDLRSVITDSIKQLDREAKLKKIRLVEKPSGEP